MNRTSLAGLCILSATLWGCAAYHNAKGKAEIVFDQPDEGVQSLATAAQKAPRDASYQIDYLSERDKYVKQFLGEADELRAQGRIAEAQAGYERVLRLEASNARAKQGLIGLQQDARHEKLLAEADRLLQLEKPDEAQDRVGVVLASNPENRRAKKLLSDIQDAKAARQIAQDKARLSRSILDSLVNLQFREATLRFAFESLSKSTGLNILVDKDVKQDAKVSMFVRDVSVVDAIDLILMQNQLDKRIVNGNTIIVYPANSAKQADYEDVVIRTFRVTNADLKYLSTMLKTMLKLKDVAADEKSGTLVVRDTPERLRMAEKLIAAHDVPDAEIMLEVLVLEVSWSRTTNIGLLPPNSFTVTTPGSTSSPLTLGQLNGLTSSDLLVSQISATLNMKMEDVDTKTLARPRIRARNREKAKIMIGDRVPTVTNTVTPVATGTPVVTGNVSYQDVGLKLEFEPQVYANSEVGIKINLEVSNIVQTFTDSNGSRTYQVGTRNAATNLRLVDGETQVLGGLISNDESNTADLIPGLGNLPIIGKLFGNNSGSDTRSEIMLAITPRIIRDIAVTAPENRLIYTGTGSMLRERPFLADPPADLKVSGTVSAPTGATANYPGAGMPQAPGANPGGVPPTGSVGAAGGPGAGGQVLFNAAPASQPLTFSSSGTAANPTGSNGLNSASSNGALLSPAPAAVIRTTP